MKYLHLHRETVMLSQSPAENLPPVFFESANNACDFLQMFLLVDKVNIAQVIKG